MRVGFTWWWVAWQLVALHSYLAAAKKTTISISRQHQGDMFTTKDVPCSNEVCVGRSSGTAALLPQSAASVCPCQCLNHLPVFRDDMQICVEDIYECPLASFLSGTTYQKIPFVFLPLKGQIVYPSAEISFTGSQSPICVVSGSQFLTGNGWMDLRNRNKTDSEPPFRLYRDEGRTFLQWLGDSELRMSMEGRLLMVNLMCKDMDNSTNIFMPCVAFRVAGSPMTVGAGVKEVSFSADAQAANSASGSGLSSTEYAAIAACSVLLGLIYVSSVLLYLHLRRRKAKEEKLVEVETGGGNHLGEQEGLVKNNPLLRHCHENSGYVSDNSCCSEDDDEEIAALPEEEPTTPQHSVQVTCAMIHPRNQFHEGFSYENMNLVDERLDSSTIERLPEENVSIVETPEGREERPETVRAITAANTRRKLYFNPAYFDLELLLAPPPAALEFLTKIREVIAIAKQKMATKRFLPSLLGIPEEVDYIPTQHRARSGSIASGSVVTVRQGGGRRRSCEGCPGCMRPASSGCQSCYIDQVTPEHKHRSIRKWLEDVPLVRPPSLPEPSPPAPPTPVPPTLAPPAPALPPVPPSDLLPTPTVALAVTKPTRHSHKGKAPGIPKQAQKNPSDRPEPINKAMKDSINKSQSMCSIVEEINKINNDLSKVIQNGQKTSETEKEDSGKEVSTKKTSDEQLENGFSNISPTSPKQEAWNDILFKESLNDYNYADDNIKVPSPPPPSVCSSMARGRDKFSYLEDQEEPKIPRVAKKLMDAVIKEFVEHRSLEPKPSPPVRTDSLPSNKESPTSIEYETDSLDRTLTRQTEEKEGMRTPSDYGGMEIRSIKNTTNSNSNNNNNGTNLPLDEELTMRNSVFNIKTGNTTISKLKNDEDIIKENEDDHDYEIILLNPENNKNHKLNLPDILSRVEGYSLVSEVYVNDGYSFGSSSSIQSNESSTPSLTNEPKIKYNEPGHLTIEVEDSPRNYERTYDSDCFEPDTLDRKPSKFKINSEGQFEYQLHRNDFYADSLERPQIALKTTGSFRSDSSICWYDVSNFSHMVGSPLNRTFGSLREIFEAKNKHHRNGHTRSETLSPVGSTRSLDTDCYSTMSLKRGKPKILRPDSKQARRQRPPSPPEYIPPRPPKAIYTNEFISRNGKTQGNSPPLPPRNNKPPLPPKNGQVRSISQRVAGLKLDQHFSVSPSVTQLSPATRGVRASASVHSPTSSDYEAVETQIGRRLETSLQREFQRKLEAHDHRVKNGLPIVKNLRDKRNINFIRKPQRSSKVPHRTEDSGYLSSDSNVSDCRKRDESLSETDDSLCDGASESGAESIATDSFFFGKSNKLSLANSVDSGVGHSVSAASVHSDTDSNISFVTVLPMEITRTSHVLVKP